MDGASPVNHAVKHTRRDFLKRTTASAAALAGVGRFAQAAQRSNMTRPASPSQAIFLAVKDLMIFPI